MKSLRAVRRSVKARLDRQDSAEKVLQRALRRKRVKNVHVITNGVQLILENDGVIQFAATSDYTRDPKQPVFIITFNEKEILREDV